MTDTLITIENVTKTFDGVRALDDVSLSVATGELTGLVGPNGSGKTTLINVINGYHTPDTGSIHFLGERIDSWKPNHIARQGISRMFQVTRIYPKLTVMENMLSVAYAVRRIPAREARDEAEAILQRLDLNRMISKYASNLSGGQRRPYALWTARDSFCWMNPLHQYIQS